MIVEAALEYAAAGLPVLPIWGVRPDGSCLCNQPDCSSPGKHPHGRLAPQGSKDASSDPKVVQAWWRQAPDCNVAIATGGHIVVIDLDGAEGIGNFAALSSHYGESLTAEVETGGGGVHLYHSKDPATLIGNQQDMKLSGGGRAKHVDVRGEGGYVVAPPSMHASGVRYGWSRDLDEMISLPGWLLDLVRQDGEIWVPNVGSKISPRDVPPDEVIRIRDALPHCPPNCSRDEWIHRVSMPLHDHFGGSDEGYDLWHEWCARGEGLTTPNGKPAYGGEHECWRIWRSFSAAHRNPRGIATLFQYARTHGWVETDVNGMPAPAAVVGGEEMVPWGDPDVPRELEPSPRMDLDRAFPPELHWLRDFVRSISRLLQVPTEFPMMLVAGVATGAYGRVYELRLDGTDWAEQAPLWVICAFQSGAGKSPVFRPIIRPFREWDAAVDQADEFAAWEARKDMARAELMLATKELQKNADRARSNPVIADKLRSVLEDARREEQAANDARPREKTILASSLTTPSMVEFLQDHQERCLIADPEGGVFQYVLGGRTDIDKDIDPWVKAFSGDAIRQNRIGDRNRKRERRVERPCLAMALCTQVTSLGLFRDDYADGKGFLPRFMPAIFTSQLPERAIVDGRVPADLAEQWRDLIHRLLATTVPEIPHEIVLDGEGARLLRGWMQDWLDRAHADEEADARSVVGYGSPSGAKVRSFAMRLVLMMHVLSTPDPMGEPVDPATVRTVLDTWMPFVTASVESVVSLVRDDPDLRIAERMLRWMQRRGTGSFSRSEAFGDLKSRGTTLTVIKRVDDLNVALQLLADAGWIQPATKPRHRGARSVAAASRYAVHPDLEKHLQRLSAQR